MSSIALADVAQGEVERSRDIHNGPQIIHTRSWESSIPFPNEHHDAEGEPSLRSLSGKNAKVDIDELLGADIVIAIMGPTGSGKSTFVTAATGLDVGIGHALESDTCEIKAVKASIPELTNSDIILVDTPGFDLAGGMSESDIFKMIATFLNNTYNRQSHLSGLLYFHRISDNRMGGTPLKNLRMFEKLCGSEFKKIVLTTTMWDEEDEDIATAREDELKEVYWKALIDQGSTIGRFHGTRRSAIQILKPLVDDANRRETILLRKEMSELHRTLGQTSAGAMLYIELEHLVEESRQIMQMIREAMARPTANEDQIQSLMQGYRSISVKLQTASSNLDNLNMSFGKRLRKIFSVVINWNWVTSLNNLFQPSSLTWKIHSSQPHLARMEELSSDDIIVVVMGLTGSGKSTFIQQVTDYDPGISNSLTPRARKIMMIKTKFNDTNIIIVDTPGFGQEQGLPDSEIIEKFEDWAKQLKSRSIKLRGMLYLHRISDDLPPKRFLPFKAISELHSATNLILATTMWNEVKEQEGEEHEQMLMQTCWSEMITKGIRTERLNEERISATRVLRALVEN